MNEIKPRRYQIETAHAIANNLGYLVADACGLGKTLMAILGVQEVRADREDFRALVVCPPSLVDQWCENLNEFDEGVQVTPTRHLAFDFAHYGGWAVTAYPELNKKHVFEAMASVVWDVIIVDEAHRIRNRTTLAAKKVKRLAYAKAVALTATPMEHGAQELWSILNFIRPDLFPTYWSYIMKHFVVEEGYYTKWEIQGLKDPIEFGKLTGPLMVQRTKEDVIAELPEKIIIPTTVSMGKEQAAIYDQIANSEDLVVNVDDVELLIKNVLTQIVRLQQVSTMPSLLGFKAPSAKLYWLHEFLDDHKGEPVAIFSRFRKVVEHIVESRRAAFVGGGKNEARKFASGETDIVACVIADSLQGVDGLQRAEHGVFLDSAWSATQMTQAIDRIHRMNITSPKNIYMLSSAPIDRTVEKALNNKWTEQELVYYFIRNHR